jgi:hypothetical protein
MRSGESSSSCGGDAFLTCAGCCEVALVKHYIYTQRGSSLRLRRAVPRTRLLVVVQVWSGECSRHALFCVR